MSNSVKKIGVDIAVALIFFNRPKPLKSVFEALRISKPSQLFLIQDGPRNETISDIEGIQACREIVENVDWDCEIHRNYSDVNLSCDHRVFTGISWAFEYVDKLVILEDDCVASQSFLPFCAEILERYKDDLRIHMISGMNYFDEFKGTEDSYFFSNTAAGWGWATWKRSWNLVIEQRNFDFLENKSISNLVAEYVKELGSKDNGIKSFMKKVAKIRYENLKTSKVNSWEYAIGIANFLSSSMIITPRINLISNIGLTNDSTHAVNTIKKLNKSTQKLFFKKTFELNFPLVHPKYVIRNIRYEQEHNKLVGANNFILFMRRIESICRQLWYSNKNERKALFNKALKKLI